ncbi:partitioning defective protein 6-like [Lineus longissimus]|uniref:partitioning defective protein 6-like n=1 Tax=Lineus longissimus TaxID=88925 RepID=UPI002B4E9A0E
MSFKNAKSPPRGHTNIVEVKSKLDAEFRRFAVDKEKDTSFEAFQTKLEKLHKLEDIPFLICYTDPVHQDLLPVNNDVNFSKALSTSKPLLRILLQRKGESYFEVNGYGAQIVRKRNPVISRIIGEEVKMRPQIRISMPEDFRRVSAIIDVDIVPESCRRVKLMKNGTDKPLGFYIRDGTSLRATAHGVEKVPGIFISRLVPGGLAESTGLIAVNDEVLEVNGIDVVGKTLDQATDMMVANSSNLIITVKPVNQRNTLAGPHRGGHRGSAMSTLSASSSQSKTSVDSDDVVDYMNKEDEEDEDEIEDHQRTESETSPSESRKDDSKTDTEPDVKSETSDTKPESNQDSLKSENITKIDSETDKKKEPVATL